MKFWVVDETEDENEKPFHSLKLECKGFDVKILNNGKYIVTAGDD